MEDSGKIVYVNLTNMEVRKEALDESVVKKYLGGRGLGAYLLYKLMSPKTDALGEDNLLIFTAGTFNGTLVPSSGRTTVTFKSPATGLYCKSSAGGGIGAYMRYAGAEALVISGKAQKPIYLFLDDGEIKFMDASQLWGKDTRETTESIIEELRDPDINITCIGQAGENLVRYASIQVSIYSSASRGGGGAVMGSKNLKAIAARGNRSIHVAHPDKFMEYSGKLMEKYKKSDLTAKIRKYGTSVDLEGSSSFPCNNFQQCGMDNQYLLSGEYMVEGGYLKRIVSCFACPVACHRYVTIDNGKYKGTFTGGPEYETVSALGGGLGNNDLTATIKANELCNIYGLDVISTGGAIQWAMECIQRGVFSKEDTDGLNLSWGNMESVIEMIRKITFRDGLGDLLAYGTKYASEKVGKGSGDWAVQAKGLEMSRVDVRSAYSYALAFAVNSRGPDHLMTECLAEFGGTPESEEVIEKITGDKKYAIPTIIEKRPEIVRWHEDIYAVSDSLGICAFPTTAQWWIDEFDMAYMFNATTGLNLTKDDIMKAGRRIITLEREFNKREGYSKMDDTLPKRILDSSVKNRIGQTHQLTRETLEQMLDGYYALHGWDPKTGFASEETLEYLEINDIVKQNYLSGKVE